MPIWDTAVGGLPTQGEAYAKLLHHLREAQDAAALLAHLARAQSGRPVDQTLADGWLKIEDLIGKMCRNVTSIATGHMN